MQNLSDDDRNLRDMTEDELDAAWELWFELMQHTNDADPPYTHGVFAYLTAESLGLTRPAGESSPSGPRAVAQAADAGLTRRDRRHSRR